MQHVSASDGKSVNGSNNRFRNRTDLFLHIQYTQAGHSVFTDVSATALYVLVASRTEGLIACTGQYHNIDIGLFTTDAQRIAHFACCSRGESIPVTFAIDRNTGNAIIVIKQNIFVFFNRSPFSFSFHFYLF